MYGYTCAHREYPFGTKLKVTNTINDKSIACVVNDRGPFVQGRDVDLSYAAAKDIELIETGTATVRIDRLGRDTSYIREVKYLSDSEDLLPYRSVHSGMHRMHQDSRRDSN